MNWSKVSLAQLLLCAGVAIWMLVLLLGGEMSTLSQVVLLLAALSCGALEILKGVE